MTAAEAKEYVQTFEFPAVKTEEGEPKVRQISPRDFAEGKRAETDEIEGIDVAVLEHLLFHHAIGEGGIHIDKYLGILKGITDGEHLSMEDPGDRTAALVFELVIKEGFDPWDIDLKRFAILYMKRMKHSVRKDSIKEDLDFITAGRLIFMAFRILRLRSNELLESLSEPDEDDYDDYMELEPWMEDDASYAYTKRVIEMKNPPVEETVTHRGDRRITLFELVEAFNEATDEAEGIREHNLRMKEERRRQYRLRRRDRKSVGQKVHNEDYEEDINRVYSILSGLDGGLIAFRQLVQVSPIDDICTFIALLFLNFDEKVDVWQEDFPRGEIYVRMPNGGKGPLQAQMIVPEAAVET